jgi:hypothetical protein
LEVGSPRGGENWSSAPCSRETDKQHEEQCAQHNELAGKIGELEKFKNKGTMYLMAALAFAAGTGWMGHLNLPTVLKFLGL